MQTFREMHLEVYRRENREAMVSLHAEGVTVGDPDARSSEAGIHYLSFYFTHREFTGVMRGELSGCNDIGHNLRACGEMLTFFDMDFPSSARGVMRVPYVNLHVPFHVRRILLRAVNMTLRRCEPGGERLRVGIPFDLRGRWSKQYGQGTGRVEWDVHGKEFFDECQRDGGATFKRCMDSLHAVGRNGTFRHTDVARVCLSKDADGFYFRVFDAKGNCRLNGGVINHGRDGAHEWSTHT